MLEGWQGEAGAEDVELGDVRYRHGMDVAVRGLAEIGGVGDLGVFVPVAKADPLRTRALEGEAEPANASAEINEAELFWSGAR